ncbi:MAG TPA: mannose-1-phosphate guanylyltransferase [Acidimicrobiia bacterium]
MTKLRPVVLSGGSGTRLWPLSTPERPKQFVPLFNGRSLFELTLARLRAISRPMPPLVVTGRPYVSLVRDALRNSGVESARVLVEPIGRNTAPAALAAALTAEPDDVLVIVPSDHLITDVSAFRDAVGLAADQAGNGNIVTFGIKPTRPETGYGYIEIGDQLGDRAHQVTRFKEKPGAAEAERLASDGGHVWNSGMFVARADHLLGEAESHCPDILAGVARALPEIGGVAGGIAIDEIGETFADVEAISFDHAIMERTDKALVIPIDVGWDDVGSYESLLAALNRDSAGNHLEGNVTISDVSGSFIKATSRAVAVAGMSDVVVVETPDAVLVVPLERSQSVRELSERADRD